MVVRLVQYTGFPLCLDWQNPRNFPGFLHLFLQYPKLNIPFYPIWGSCIAPAPWQEAEGLWPAIFPGFILFFLDFCWNWNHSTTFPGFSLSRICVSSFFKVFQVEWGILNTVSIDLSSFGTIRVKHSYHRFYHRKFLSSEWSNSKTIKAVISVILLHSTVHL